jgi:hypothetical protein
MVVGTVVQQPACTLFVAVNSFALAELEISDQTPQLLRVKLLIVEAVDISHVFIRRDGVLV